ncbi:hypothetical protein UPYG_G00127120 [Umbra pygmaea]|uniref:SH3 domain-containing protein n=1 Tax=Umbra pygmaea TaxID=75934 RepID=A0ABD0X6A9_UMBPY
MSPPVAPAYQANLPSVPSGYEAMMSPPIVPAYQAKLGSVPSGYEAMMSPPIAPAYQAMQPLTYNINTLVSAALSPCQSPGPVAVMEQSRSGKESPGVPRSIVSITEFLQEEDYSRAMLSTPEPCPCPSKAPVAPADDFTNHQDSHLHPPKASSPMESEADYCMERSTARLVSMDEFIKQEQQPNFNTQPKGYAGGIVEPPYGAADASRGSDLSDILEEEEDDVYSDPPGPALPRGYTTGANREHCREPSMEAGAGCSGQAELSPRLNRADVRQQLKESMEPARPIGEHEVRIFVALFPYDPVNMSPNPDAAEEELPFREGQIIKIYGDKDSDGFYRGESSGRHGYVPCNMVSEIQVEDEETRETLLRQGFLSTAVNMEKMASGSEEDQGDVFQTALLSPPAHTSNRPSVESAALWEESLDLASQDPNQPGAAVVNLAATGPHRMKAIFDYDPRESSPNADIEAELTFSAGDIIYVFGDMDDDGFFYGDLNGHKGLVPSNFLQAAPEAAGKVSDPQAPPHAVTQSRRESQVIPGPCVNETTPDSVNPPPLHAGLTGPAQHLHLDPPASAAMIDPSSTDPGEGPRSPNPPHTPAECSPKPDQRDTSLPEKKKRGFFSKGKKLLKKLGSNKKD